MIKEYKKIIEDNLEEYFSKMLLLDEFVYAKKTIEAMKYTTCLDGKRLRGILCLESSRLNSCDYKNAIPAAMALEMLHAQSLIHDDLPSMDNDDLRRGKPSNHKVFGEAFAILAGDALISLGAELIIEKTNLSEEKLIKVVREYLKAAGIFGIVAGQSADIDFEDKKNPDDSLIQFIQNYKTAALFVASCTMGAIIGGADEGVIKAYGDFAKSFGILFQIADDILDVVSSTKELGKTAGKDEKENKLTYVRKYGLSGAKEKLNVQFDKTYAILKSNNINSLIFNEILEQTRKKVLN